MAQRGGNRQQKQAAKAVRRKQAVAARKQVERLASSPSGRIAVAAASPVERCLRLADIVETGIGHVILAKRLPSGALGCAFFLVDLLCLGVKDAFYREMAPSDLDAKVVDLSADGQVLVPLDPASAKKLLLEAVAFAAESGLGPDKDYRAVFKVFDGIDAASATESFPLGRDGKVLFIPGPYDTPARVREIERALMKTRGIGGWSLDAATHIVSLERDDEDGSFDDDPLDDGLVIEHEGSTDPKSA